MVFVGSTSHSGFTTAKALRTKTRESPLPRIYHSRALYDADLLQHRTPQAEVIVLAEYA